MGGMFLKKKIVKMSKPENVILKYDDWNSDQLKIEHLRKRVDELEKWKDQSKDQFNKELKLKQDYIDRISKTQTTSVLNLLKLAFQHAKEKDKKFLNLELVERLLKGAHSFGEVEFVSIDGLTLVKEKI